MEKYFQKKSYFYFGTFFMYLMILFCVVSAKMVFHSDRACGSCLACVPFAIMVNISMYRDYKKPIILCEKQMTITSRGVENTVLYSEIMRIEYQGIRHCFLRDAMIIYCGTKGKIYIEAAYEDYLTLWNKIIAKASENNPRVTVSSKMIRRLGKKNTGDG